MLVIFYILTDYFIDAEQTCRFGSQGSVYAKTLKPRMVMALLQLNYFIDRYFFLRKKKSETLWRRRC